MQAAGLTWKKPSVRMQVPVKKHVDGALFAFYTVTCCHSCGLLCSLFSIGFNLADSWMVGRFDVCWKLACFHFVFINSITGLLQKTGLVHLISNVFPWYLCHPWTQKFLPSIRLTMLPVKYFLDLLEVLLGYLSNLNLRLESAVCRRKPRKSLIALSVAL